MSIRERIERFRADLAAADRRLDELNAKRPAPESGRQLTDEESRAAGEQSVVLDQQQGLID